MLGLFWGELIFGGAYNWKEFCVSKWVGLDNKNSLKHYENSLKELALTGYGLILGGLIIGRIFASEIWGAYFREGLLSEFYGMYKINSYCGIRGICQGKRTLSYEKIFTSTGILLNLVIKACFIQSTKYSEDSTANR